MPYVPKSERTAFDEAMKLLVIALTGASEGQVNYCLTRLLLHWKGENPNYAKHNAVMGILSSVKAEYYRRAVAPYEDRKSSIHGDVF